jgi:hypothetical protein
MPPIILDAKEMLSAKGEAAGAILRKPDTALMAPARPPKREIVCRLRNSFAGSQKRFPAREL